MAVKECVTENKSDTGKLKLMEAINTIAKKKIKEHPKGKPPKSIWLYELEEALDNLGYKLGDYFAGPTKTRRIAIAMSQGKKAMRIRLEAGGMSSEEAQAQLDKLAGFDGWVVKETPKFDLDFDKFMKGLQ
jgi:hypothetical protein